MNTERHEEITRAVVEMVSQSAAANDGVYGGDWFTDAENEPGDRPVHMVDLEFPNMLRAMEWASAIRLMGDAIIRDVHMHTDPSKPVTLTVSLLAFLFATRNL